MLRHRRNEPRAFLYVFDLPELNGTGLRREPIEVRKATLASILRKSRHGVRPNEHLEHGCGLTVFQHARKMGLERVPSDLATFRIPVPFAKLFSHLAFSPSVFAKSPQSRLERQCRLVSVSGAQLCRRRRGPVICR